MNDKVETAPEIKENWKTYECPNCGDVCDIDINDPVGAWHHRWKSVTCPECGELMEPTG